MRCEAHFRENAWIKGEWNGSLIYAVLARKCDKRRKRFAGGWSSYPPF